MDSEYEKTMYLYKNKYSDVLTEDIIKHYSSKFNLDREAAILKLVVNFEKEANGVDSREIALKAMKGIRQMSPQLGGLVDREKDTLRTMDALRARSSGLEEDINILDGKLEIQKEVLKNTIKYINNIMSNDMPPKGFFNKIKWILKN